MYTICTYALYYTYISKKFGEKIMTLSKLKRMEEKI